MTFDEALAILVQQKECDLTKQIARDMTHGKLPWMIDLAIRSDWEMKQKVADLLYLVAMCSQALEMSREDHASKSQS